MSEIKDGGRLADISLRDAIALEHFKARLQRGSMQSYQDEADAAYAAADAFIVAQSVSHVPTLREEGK